MLEMGLKYPVIIAEETFPIIEDRCIEAHLDPDNNENNEIQINNENQNKKAPPIYLIANLKTIIC